MTSAIGQDVVDQIRARDKATAANISSGQAIGLHRAPGSVANAKRDKVCETVKNIGMDAARRWDMIYSHRANPISIANRTKSKANVKTRVTNKPCQEPIRNFFKSPHPTPPLQCDVRQPRRLSAYTGE
jgi:hypothetical protein